MMMGMKEMVVGGWGRRGGRGYEAILFEMC